MRTTTILAIALLLGPAAGKAPAQEGIDPRGFIYGTVETESGNTYEGILRWGREEIFWGDHFNSTKDKPPPGAERRERRGRRPIKVFGVTVGHRDDWGRWGHQLVARFGDIASIEIERGDEATVTMKNGSVYRIDGGSNDIGATITVFDKALGEVKLSWKKIERITFSATPRDAQVPAARLYGVLTTEDDERFEGFVQWDIQECLTIDELDGETEDGELSIEMGKIRAIEKRNRHGAWVELADGRRLLLEDTNDVDHSTDGIFIEDDRFGRVEVAWDEFDRLDFQPTRLTGRGYDDYPPARKLSGTVTDEDGNTFRGEIVYDLDETETWEMLNGDRNDLEYHIPFELVRSIEPLSRDSSRVVLKSGLELVLEDSHDVSDDNEGIVIRGAGEDGEDAYLEWDEVRRIDFD